MKKNRKITSHIRPMRMRVKLMCIFFSMFMLSIMALIWVVNATFSKAMVQRMVQNTVSESELMQMQISSLTSATETSANFIVKLIGNAQYEENGSDYTHFQYISYINAQIRYALTLHSAVDSAIFVDSLNNTYTITRSNQENVAQAVNPDFLSAVKASTGGNLWFSTQQATKQNQGEPVLVLGKKILDVKTLDTLGYLFLNIKEESIARLYTGAGEEPGMLSYLVDRDGVVLSSTDKASLQQKEEEEAYRSFLLSQSRLYRIQERNGEEKLSVTVPVAGLGWHFVREIPMRFLAYDANQLTRIVLLIGGLVLVVTLIGVGIMSDLLTRPLRKLCEVMEQVKGGNLRLRFKWEHSDEVGDMATGFNDMLDRIQGLLATVEQEQRQKRRYELALIQAQIKPHFLYNTLDTIFLLSKLGESENAQKTTKALADFYRTSLSSGREIISVGEEMQNVDAYLQIQKMRYEDVFDYSVSLDGEVAQCRVPKLTVQPIVENAIYHGLKACGHKGLLAVRGCIQKEGVLLTVTDNGLGMSQERLRSVADFSADDAPHPQSFGLSSVHKRVQLYFGPEYGLSIHSAQRQGTSVCIRLPAQAAPQEREGTET